MLNRFPASLPPPSSIPPAHEEHLLLDSTQPCRHTRRHSCALLVAQLCALYHAVVLQPHSSTPFAVCTHIAESLLRSCCRSLQYHVVVRQVQVSNSPHAGGVCRRDANVLLPRHVVVCVEHVHRYDVAGASTISPAACVEKSATWFAIVSRRCNCSPDVVAIRRSTISSPRNDHALRAAAYAATRPHHRLPCWRPPCCRCQPSSSPN
jgi:hypothetical protein